MKQKQMKRCISLVLAGIIMLGMFTGCAKNSESGATEQDSKSTKIRVGIVTNTMGVPAAYALENGYYAAENLEVEPVIFSTGSLVNEAMAAGEIDIAFSGLASIFSMATGTASWIGEINTTAGLGIYVRPDSPILNEKGVVSGYENVYGSAESLKGAQILGPLGNVAQYLAANWIQIFGLTDQDVEIVNMDYGAAYQAFVSGQGDAVSLNNPYTFQAEENGYICAATFEDATNTYLNDGIFGNTEFINENRDAIIGFLRATYKASDALQDEEIRYEFSMKWFADNGKEYTENDMRAEMGLRKYLTAEYMTQSDYVFGKGMLKIADFYVSDGKIIAENIGNVSTSIDVSLLNEALNISAKSAVD